MSFESIIEKIPSFIRRINDYVLEGSNNALLFLGTDRAKKGPATVDDGIVKPGTGAALLVVGRQDSNGNPNIDTDSALLYLSMLTDVDKNLGTTMEGDAGQKASAILKADCIRIVARNDIKIVVNNCYFFLNKDGGTMKLGDTTINFTTNTANVKSPTVTVNASQKANVTSPLVEINSQKVVLGEDSSSLDPTQGILNGQTVDPFTGLTYAALQGASATVFAKK